MGTCFSFFCSSMLWPFVGKPRTVSGSWQSEIPSMLLLKNQQKKDLFHFFNFRSNYFNQTAVGHVFACLNEQSKSRGLCWMNTLLAAKGHFYITKMPTKQGFRTVQWSQQSFLFSGNGKERVWELEGCGHLFSSWWWKSQFPNYFSLVSEFWEKTRTM